MSDTAAVTCSTCKACCCQLEVMLMGEDEPPERYTRQDQWGGWVMHRLDDGFCAALNRETHLCTIYERRPTICRDFEAGDSDCLTQRLQLVVRPA
ncbi:MAG TPA: YkgJ family cysteine cluster protein [Rhodocyclaceae bacterium]|jgi:Fe-S-cluster containining protein